MAEAGARSPVTDGEGTRRLTIAAPPAMLADALPATDSREATDAAIRILRDPATIRARCNAIAAAVASGDSSHFRVDRSRMPMLAQRVATLTRSRFPDLVIPYHSRWRHFEAGGFERKETLDRYFDGRSSEELARARIDLTLISVLLDAGAGPSWRYIEFPDMAHLYARSEGLAVASFQAFIKGRFSSDPDDPYRVDARALMEVDATSLAGIFQAGLHNPLVGLEGRAALLRRLGEALRDQPRSFGLEGRPGRLFDVLTAQASDAGRALSAADVLVFLLDSFSDIWPSGQRFAGTAVGDVWPHPHAGGDGASAGLVPFHKLSQWLTYSLLEPFEWAGHALVGLDALTGLPEYRNGGLLIDSGVLVPLGKAIEQPMKPADAWIVEWRALTVALLDELAPLVRDELGVDDTALPLACILEGGTWAAGRAIAAELRPGGAPPVTVDSDGTVF